MGSAPQQPQAPVEFETDPAQSEPPLPLRMLDYFVRVYRRERCPVRQIVIVLAETRAEIPAEFHVGATRHGYRVLKLWEQGPAPRPHGARVGGDSVRRP